MELDPRRLDDDEEKAKQGQKALSKACEEWFSFIESKVSECPLYV